MHMTIYIDGDACPVIDITVKIAAKFHISCTILCDTAHLIQRQDVTTVIVDKTADSVDFKLVNLLRAGDIAVTQDYGLAAMCLAKGAYAIHQNGIIYTSENIDRLLYTRYVSGKIRAAGGRTKGPAKRTAQQDEEYAAALTKLLESLQ